MYSLIAIDSIKILYLKTLSLNVSSVTKNVNHINLIERYNTIINQENMNNYKNIQYIEILVLINNIITNNSNASTQMNISKLIHITTRSKNTEIAIN